MGNQPLQVFISSKMQELAPEREAIKAALAEHQIEAWVFEKDSGARSQSIQQTFIEEVEAADLYIGIFWKGYGAYTIEEFEHAQTLGMDCLIYEKRDEVEGERDPELQAFLDQVGAVEEGVATPKWFRKPVELGELVKADVASWQAQIVRERDKFTASELHIGVPARAATHFLGRDELVLQLVRRLQSGKERIMALEGLPGVGKTTLAIALVRHRGVWRHFREGVIWAGLGPSADVMSALETWSKALDGDVSSLVSAAEWAQAVKDAIGRKRMLLVIDDVWDMEAAKALCCGGPNCCHLLTTRDKGIARAFGGPTQAQSVPALDDETAYQLLEQLAPEACAADPTAAQSLVRAVGGLPLVLELIGGYLAAPERVMFPDLSQKALAQLEDPKYRLHLAQNRLGTLVGEKVTLEETIALSLEGLPEQAAEAFYALGAFSPKPEWFSREAAEAVTEADLTTLSLLGARNLVEVDPEGQYLAIHQLLADVAHKRLDEDAVVRHQAYYLAMVEENLEDWQRIEAAYGQIKWAWESLPEDASLLEWVWALCIYQELRGLRQDFLDWASRGLRVAEKEGLRKDEGTLLNNIGLVYDNLGQRDKALEYYEKALPIREEVGDRSGLATTLTNIGLVYDNLGQRDKALEYYEKALPIREEVGDRSGLATTLNNIGGVYDNLGQRDKALEYYEKALPIREEVGDRSGLAATLTNIGLVYYKLGQRDKALEYYEKALPIQKEVGDRSGLAATLNNIGGVYNNLGQRDKALEYYEKALPIREEVGDRSGLATTLNNIGAVYRKLGQGDKALEYYEKALPIREEVGDRSGLGATLNNIGAVYRKLGQGDKALEYYEKALPILEEVGDRSVFATTLSNIGLVYDNLGQRDKALEYYEKALPMREEVGDRSGESITRYNMAMIYRTEGRLAEAVSELKKVVELDRLVQHPDLQVDMAKLAEVEAELARQQE